MSSDLGTIVVLAGGLSHERDVSLRSGRRVAQALRDRGHQVIESDVNAALADLLATSPVPLAEATLADRFTGRGPWKKRLPQILQTLEAVGRARAEPAAGSPPLWRGA